MENPVGGILNICHNIRQNFERNLPKITFNGVNIPKNQNVKYLGVILGEN